MQTMLLPLEESDGLPSILRTALLAATAFGSYIEGLHVRPGLTGVVAAGAEGLVAATPGLIESFEREDQARARSASAPPSRPSCARTASSAAGRRRSGRRLRLVRGDDARATSTIGSRGRVFDLIVVGRPMRGGSELPP